MTTFSHIRQLMISGDGLTAAKYNIFSRSILIQPEREIGTHVP